MIEKIGPAQMEALRRNASLPAYGIKKRLKDIAAQYRKALKAL
jgi:hypothetical protein